MEHTEHLSVSYSMRISVSLIHSVSHQRQVIIKETAHNYSLSFLFTSSSSSKKRENHSVTHRVINTYIAVVGCFWNIRHCSNENKFLKILLVMI